MLLTTVAIAGVAFYQSSRQAALYSSSAQVLLKYQSLASGLTGIQDLSTVYQDPQRIAQTQTQIAMSPDVANRVVEAAEYPGARREHVPRQRARHRRDRLGHPRLQHHLRRHRDGRAPRDDPRAGVHHAPARARHGVARRCAQGASRPDRRARADGLQGLGSARGADRERAAAAHHGGAADRERVAPPTRGRRRADTAAREARRRSRRDARAHAGHRARLRPRRPRHARALRRQRSATGSGRRFSLGSRRRRRSFAATNRLVMIASPHSAHAEAFRMLRSNLEFVNLDRGARSILVTSALEKEGKSTTVANLAVALARAGQKVALVDLDLRRPALAKFFGIPKSHPGVTNVVVGSSTLDQALVEVGRMRSGVDDMSPSQTATAQARPAAQEFSRCSRRAGSPRRPRRGRQLEAADGCARAALASRSTSFSSTRPPLLSVGDTMTLSAHVDAMITVARLNMLRRPNLAGARPGTRDLPDDQARRRRHRSRDGAGLRLWVRLRVRRRYHRAAEEMYEVNLPPATSAGVEESVR